MLAHLNHGGVALHDIGSLMGYYFALCPRTRDNRFAVCGLTGII